MVRQPAPLSLSTGA